jgi:hypothetical protein
VGPLIVADTKVAQHFKLYEYCRAETLQHVHLLIICSPFVLFSQFRSIWLDQHKFNSAKAIHVLCCFVSLKPFIHQAITATQRRQITERWSTDYFLYTKEIKKIVTVRFPPSPPPKGNFFQLRAFLREAKSSILTL